MNKLSRKLMVMILVVGIIGGMMQPVQAWPTTAMPAFNPNLNVQPMQDHEQSTISELFDLGIILVVFYGLYDLYTGHQRYMGR